MDEAAAIAKVQGFIDALSSAEMRWVVTRVIETDVAWICAWEPDDGQPGFGNRPIVVLKASGELVHSRFAYAEFMLPEHIGLLLRVRRWAGRRVWGRPISDARPVSSLVSPRPS